ncbi:MAG: hypothetical protein GX758_02435, partial [Tenericutes bacterium]|nr:hypothetical protein [Mycoplasmatota bacterium]
MNIKKSKKTINIMPYILLTIVVVGSYIFLNTIGTKINTLDYSTLTNELNRGNVEELYVTPRSGQGVYILTGKLKDYKKTESFTVTIPYTDTVISSIYQSAESQDLKVQTKTNPESSMWLTVVVNIVPIVIFGILIYIMFTKLGNNGKG